MCISGKITIFQRIIQIIFDYWNCCTNTRKLKLMPQNNPHPLQSVCVCVCASYFNSTQPASVIIFLTLPYPHTFSCIQMMNSKIISPSKPLLFYGEREHSRFYASQLKLKFNQMQIWPRLELTFQSSNTETNCCVRCGQSVLGEGRCGLCVCQTEWRRRGLTVCKS